jgi:hypothetical protein
MFRLTGLVFALSVIVVAQDAIPIFEPMQPDVLGGGANFTNAFADFDNDGDLDLFVGFDGKPNRLYRNDKGAFTDVAAEVGVADARPTRAAAWGDFDSDGDPDLLVGFTPLNPPSPEASARQGASVLKLYRNTSGKFTDATEVGLVLPAGAVRQPAWIDFDGDGDLDLFVAFRDRANALYRNDAGSLTEIAASIGLDDKRRTVGAVWFDFDEDGDLDAAVANMDGDANGLFRNDAGRFTDVAEAAGVSNRGKGAFDDRSAAWQIAIDSRYDACAFADVDHNGTLDLYVNGTVTGGASWQDSLFMNGGSSFTDRTPPVIRKQQADHGVQWADVDGDGDLDLALTGSRADGTHVVMRNMLPASDAARSVQVRVVDAKGRATRAGAEVRVYAAASSKAGLIGTRLVDSGSGYDAQSDMPVHFGLPAGVSRVDVQVIVPAGGKRIPIWQRGVAAGKTVTVRTN